MKTKDLRTILLMINQVANMLKRRTAGITQKNWSNSKMNKRAIAAPIHTENTTSVEKLKKID